MFELIIGLSIGCIVYLFTKSKKKANKSNVKPFVGSSPETQLGDQKSKQKVVPHKKRNYLCTKTENKFYQVLRDVLPPEYIVHSQVSMMALVQPVNFKDNSKTWAKRMDFVITDKNTKIMAVIELDDSSHRQQKRQERDIYVNNAFKNLHPLLRFEAMNIYDKVAIIQRLKHETDIQYGSKVTAA
ncbi:hypothetical protein BWP24_27455 (plasmid) [Vibrio campbellii]|uniref:DUF2726 domain-containing protein n=1 Tax=Vibrio campbellii TaxID=680 RepID=UPI0009717423|nr:DUF2726 domain-containing protein [Vibrio campbellii]APX09944.1 hypothetical protein BWP24_27455 [Vibrio campbellii]ARR10384.1 hypothetical protein Vc3S01_p30042 [Vibrio campbellii]